MEMDRIRETVFNAVEDAEIDRDDIVFIYVFGSYTADEPRGPASDIDVCISLDVDAPARAGYSIQGRLPEQFDLSVFERLPPHVQKSVLEGKLVYTRSRDEVYDKALQTIHKYESFHPLYQEAVGGPV